MDYWAHQEGIKYQNCGEIKDFLSKDNIMLLKLSRGLMRIKVLSPNCIRVTFTAKDGFLDIPSFAVINEPVDTSFSIYEGKDEIILKTGLISIHILKESAGITVKNLNGLIISEDIGFGFSYSKDTIKCKKAMSENDHFYGLGEKTGFLDKKGKKYTMWNTDEYLHTPTKDPLYTSIPLLISFNEKHSYGIFVDKTCKSWFDLGEESQEYYSFEVDDFEIDYYFIYGPDIKDVISIYTSLTGKMNLPPMWALGYQQSRWGYYPETVVRSLADKFREEDIPCDVIYLDVDYMDEYRIFTWSPNRFPEPEKMIKDLNEKGFKIVTIVDPGVKKDTEYDVYLEGTKNDLFCKNADGEIYYGKVWPGDSAYPDFTKGDTREWWSEKHKELLGKGIAGIWNDMNEPSDFAPESNGDRTLVTVPNDIMMDNDGYPRTFRRYHNSYGFNMCRSTYEGFKKYKPGERPFMVTRSAYAGIQRYSAVWTGDNHSWWEHLASSMPMYMNIGLSGVPFVGGDVGGFQDNASAELYVRWMQLGAFTPFFRAHTTMNSKPHEPWSFGKEALDICRKYIKLRYSLMPYNYNEFYKSSKTGLPVMKPLVLEYIHDENVHNMSDQFIYGESMMLAPIYRPATFKKYVYIPGGTWYNYWNDEKYEGPCHILVDSPLDTIPIFVKAGAIIPTIPAVNYIGEKQADILTLDIYSGKDSNYMLYEDDGTSNKYKAGEYSLTNFTFCQNEKQDVFCIIPQKKNYSAGRKKYNLRFHGIDKSPVSVYCGDEIIYDNNEEKGILNITVSDTMGKQVIIVNYK